MSQIKCVLFDLDGTLVDTAPDLGYAANMVRAEQHLAPLDMRHYRPVASAGARGLLKVALGIDVDHADFPRHRDRFLEIYRDNLSRNSALFAGLDDVLKAFARKGLLWGVVTNKPDWLAQPLLGDLDLVDRAACAIGARDGLLPKPAPDLLHHACELLGLDATECVYVGDDRRDIDAARAAGMLSIAAGWGYIAADDSVGDWNADVVIASPAELLSAIEKW